MQTDFLRSAPLPRQALLWLTALLAFLVTSVAIANELPPGVKQGPTVEGVTEYTLDNGLRVLLAPEPSRATTTVNMTYLVGSRHENYGETGMAHLLEHMLFRGTPTLRNALAEFSKRGLAANGTTSADRTNYYASFAANPDTLNWYLNWQADVMVNALILREDLDAEMTVVRNEMERNENSPFQMLMQKMLAAAFQWHNYGKSTIGARSDVENVDIEQLRAFYRRYYQPDNAVLIVSGQFNVADTLLTVQKAFGTIPKPARTLPAEYTEEPVQDGERQVILRRQGGSPLAAALYHAPQAASPDYPALELATGILTDTPAGPLYKNLVEPGLASTAFGFSAGQRQPGYVLFGAQLEPGMDPEKALGTLTSTLEARVAQQSVPADTTQSVNPFTTEALDRVRSRWLSGWSQTYADPAALASALSEASADGDWRLFFLQRDRVQAMPLEHVTRVAQAWLVQSNRTQGLYLPTEAPERAPATADINLTDLVANYTGKAGDTTTQAFDSSARNIDDSTQRAPLVLDNGTIELALLPKPTRGDRVEASLLMQFGTAESLKGQREVAAAVAALLDKGTKNRSRQDIEDRLTALDAEVGFSGSGGVVGVGISTLGKNLPDTLEVVFDILRNANLPANELEQYQKRVNTAINNAKSEPTALASRTLARHDNPWPADDIRYTPTFDEEQARIAALTREQLARFHDRFYGAGSLRFAAVGSFDPDAVRAALQAGVKGWKRAPDYVRVDDPYRPVKPETFLINTPDKANAFLLAAAPLRLQDTNPDYPALVVGNYLLGGSATSRLWNRVRVQDGLSYTVGSGLEASSYEPSGSWSIYAIHAPENTRKLETAVSEELNRVLTDGFSEQEVREAVTALLNFRKLARTRDGTLVSTWISYLELDRTFAWSEAMDQHYAALNAEQVNAALKKYLKPAELSKAVAADQAKQEPTAN